MLYVKSIGDIDMTQEEKQLLLKDLCARLPYGVKVKYFDMEYPFGSEPVILTPYLLYNRWENIHDVKPYLRTMSSMNEEERLIYEQRLHDVGRSIDVIDADDVVSHIDWLLSRHLDFRGLIPMGLALEALPGMYKTE